MFVAATLLTSHAASAAVVYNVNSTLDEIDDDTSDGICHTAAGTCTLRAAVMQANFASGPGATVMVPAGIYTLVRPIGPDGGGLTLTSPVNGTTHIDIIGAGAASTIVDANQIDRVFGVQANRVATISGVTLRNGYASLLGAGIVVSQGIVTLNDVTIRDNTCDGVGGGIGINGGSLVLNHGAVIGNKALSGSGGGVANAGDFIASYSVVSGNQAYHGGGIINYGTATISHSTVSGNSADEGGGVYVDDDATLELDRTTVSGNGVTGFGGGIRVTSAGTLIVIESTISSNHSDVLGGGILSAGTTNIYSSTIAFNQASANSISGLGGGILIDSGHTNVRNTVVAGNYLSDPATYNDCTGVLGVYGNDKFWSTSGCTADIASTGSGSFLGSLDELGPLQDNGGPTQTHAIVAPSAMIDGGDASLGCIDDNIALLTTDQRDAPRVAGARCDIGAFEYGSQPDLIFASGFE